MPFEQTLKLHVLSKFCYDTQKVNPVFPHKSEAVVWKCSVEKVFLKFYQNSKENTCGRVSFLRPKACNFIKKETLAQVLSCEFCEMSKNAFFTAHLLATASNASPHWTLLCSEGSPSKISFFSFMPISRVISSISSKLINLH